MIRVGIILLAILLSVNSHASELDERLADMRAEVMQGEAFAFSLKDLAGTSHDLSEWQGKVILLNFWATWCGPCRVEMPGMQRLWQKHREQGFVILAVSVDEGMEKRISTFVQRLQLTYPVLLDPESIVSDHYQVSGLPFSLLIDREGQLIAKVVGEREWDSPEASLLITSLLNQ